MPIARPRNDDEFHQRLLRYPFLQPTTTSLPGLKSKMHARSTSPSTSVHSAARPGGRRLSHGSTHVPYPSIPEVALGQGNDYESSAAAAASSIAAGGEGDTSSWHRAADESAISLMSSDSVDVGPQGQGRKASDSGLGVLHAGGVGARRSVSPVLLWSSSPSSRLAGQRGEAEGRRLRALKGAVTPFLSPSPSLDNSSLACRLLPEELIFRDLGWFKLVLIVLGRSSWSICR